MNPERFTEYIERAVGPVRAADWRKDRMREELAAHLAASWEQERSRDGDDTAAVERALRRIGENGELSRCLQDAVPRLERWLFTPVRSMSWIDAVDRMVSPRKHETPLHHAVRVTAGLTAAIALAELIVVPLAIAINARPRTDWATTLLWAIASLVVTGAGGIAFMLLGSAMARAIEDGGAGRAASSDIAPSRVCWRSAWVSASR